MLEGCSERIVEVLALCKSVGLEMKAAEEFQRTTIIFVVKLRSWLWSSLTLLFVSSISRIRTVSSWSRSFGAGRGGGNRRVLFSKSVLLLTNNLGNTNGSIISIRAVI